MLFTTYVEKQPWLAARGARQRSHTVEMFLSVEMFVLTYPRDTGSSLQTHTHTLYKP